MSYRNELPSWTRVPDEPPVTMRQYAPYPRELHDAVAELRYMPEWGFSLEDIERDSPGVHHGSAGGLTLAVRVPCFDSYHPEQFRPVWHYFPVPAATYNRAAWEAWIGDCLDAIHRHERCEWQRFGADERRPFAPLHGPGDNPYSVTTSVTDRQRATSFQGVVKGDE